MNAQTQPGDDQVSLLSILTVLIRQRFVILGAGVLVAALVIGNLARKPRTYTATTTFIPQGGPSAASGLTGLAAQLGLAVPTSSSAASPAFYMDLLDSRALLARVAGAKYSVRTASGPKQGTLADVYGIGQAGPEARLANAIGLLRKHSESALQKNTGGVQVAVHEETPELAKAIADRILLEVNTFNLEMRRSQASGERKYLEQRLGDAKTELRTAEDAVQRFSETNRGMGSPHLLIERERLQRDVEVRQQVYISLAQAYEQARLAELRDLPSITVLEPPQQPLSRDAKPFMTLGILGFIAGCVLGIVLGLLREYVQRARAENSPELNQLVNEFNSALRRR